MKDDLIYIEHILNSIERIELYISDIEENTFLGDYILQDAVVRQLEIIGEATERISMDFRLNHHEVPWADMAGMRDVLIHDYIDVDFEIVWKTVIKSIPELKKLLVHLINKPN